MCCTYWIAPVQVYTSITWSRSYLFLSTVGTRWWNVCCMSQYSFHSAVRIQWITLLLIINLLPGGFNIENLISRVSPLIRFSDTQVFLGFNPRDCYTPDAANEGSGMWTVPALAAAMSAFKMFSPLENDSKRRRFHCLCPTTEAKLLQGIMWFFMRFSENETTHQHLFLVLCVAINTLVTSWSKQCNKLRFPNIS